MNTKEIKEKYFPQQGLLERYKNYTRAEETEWAVKSQKDRVKEDKQAAKIIALLQSWGATNIETNAYWFHFDYRGLHFEVVSQKDRVVGDAHERVHTTDEKEMLGHFHMLKHKNRSLYDDICTGYGYRDIHEEGDPVRAFKTILKRNLGYVGD